MQNNVRAIILDMDGLMLDTEPLYKVAWQAAAAELGYVLDDMSYAKLVGRPNNDCEREVMEQFGSDFPLERFRSRWPELWQREVSARGIAMKPGLLEFLAFLEIHGLPVAVATSSDAAYAVWSLKQAGLDGRFAVVVAGDEVARGKPAPDIYVEAAHRLGISPARCVALEDSEPGVLAASGAGMITILIPDWINPSDAAVRAAFRVLKSLDEAQYVVADLVAKAPKAG